MNSNKREKKRQRGAGFPNLHGTVVHNHGIEFDARVQLGHSLAGLQEEPIPEFPAIQQQTNKQTNNSRNNRGDVAGWGKVEEE